jgi:hypothetical protein
MNFLGITLRRPRFSELTAAAVMAAGLWLLALAGLRALQMPLDRAEAGALLLMVAWGSMSVRFGLRMDQSQRHAVLNVAGAALLMALYQGALTLAG